MRIITTRKARASFFAIFMLLLLGFTLLPMVRSVKASGSSETLASISLNPRTYSSSGPGESFTVSVCITGASDLRGFELKLGYDPKIAEALQVEEGPFLKHFGTSYPVKLEINKTQGSILIAIVLLSSVPAEGDGTLATIDFKSLFEGQCLFDLYDSLLVDFHAKALDHFVTDGYSLNEYVDPPSPTISDPMETGWEMREVKGLDGYEEWGYSSATYTSPPTSLLAHVWGWGIRGEDYETLYINKTFPWQPYAALTRLTLNYLIDTMTDGDGWGGMAVLTQINVITHDADGRHVYSYIVAGATTDVPDWSYNMCADYGPNVKYINWLNEQIPAPGHGELEPPTGIWYTLDRNVDADFEINWDTVTAIEIEIAHGGGYLHQDDFKVFFDDLGLNETPYALRARFTTVPETATPGQIITFDASSSRPGWDGTNEIPITEYRWDFGDGNTAPTSDPTIQHSYSTESIYQVTLTVYAPGSVPEYDSTTKTVKIVLPTPKALFTYTPAAPKTGELVTFDGSSSTPNGGMIISYEWDFGDGQHGTGQMATHTYWSAGQYTATLQVTDSEGYSDIEQKTIQLISWIPCDFNDDGIVNEVDFELLIKAFWKTGPPGWIKQDMNSDGIVNIIDLAMFFRSARNWETIPPVTTMHLDGLSKASGWFISDVTVTLSATDNWSGISKTEYSYDAITWIDYTNPFLVTTEGTTVIYFYSIDNSRALNVEQVKSGTISIDKTAPLITTTSPEIKNYTQNEVLLFGFGATDSLSGISSVTGTIFPDPAVLRLNPQNSGAEVGNTFSVDIWVEDVVDLYCWTVKLKYDPTILSYETIVEGDFLKTNGLTFFLTGNGEGWLAGGCTLLGSVPGASGNGYLARVTFRCIASGECSLSMADVDTWLTDSNHNDIPFDVVDGHFTTSLPPEEHDVAVTSLAVSENKVISGDSILVMVGVENQGTRTEIFDLTAYYGSNIIGTQAQILLAGEESRTLTFVWNTAGVGIGLYTIGAEATIVPGETDTADNTYSNGFVSVGMAMQSGQSISLSTFPPGKYTFTVTATDVAGNEAVKSITFNVLIHAIIDVKPDTLNLRSKGNWITAYIELPEGYSVADINVSTVMFNGIVPAELKPTAIGDYDRDGIPDLMLKFNRSAVVQYMVSQGVEFADVTATMSGRLKDGTSFQGSDVLRVSGLVGDVNCDGRVNMKDLALGACALWSHPGELRWNDNANFAEPWGIINLVDLARIACHYGQHYP